MDKEIDTSYSIPQHNVPLRLYYTPYRLILKAYIAYSSYQIIMLIKSENLLHICTHYGTANVLHCQFHSRRQACCVPKSSNPFLIIRFSYPNHIPQQALVDCTLPLHGPYPLHPSFSIPSTRELLTIKPTSTPWDFELFEAHLQTRREGPTLRWKHVVRKKKGRENIGKLIRGEMGVWHYSCKWIWDLGPSFGSIIPLCSVLIADVGYFTLR